MSPEPEDPVDLSPVAPPFRVQHGARGKHDFSLRQKCNLLCEIFTMGRTFGLQCFAKCHWLILGAHIFHQRRIWCVFERPNVCGAETRVQKFRLQKIGMIFFLDLLVTIQCIFLFCTMSLQPRLRNHSFSAQPSTIQVGSFKFARETLLQNGLDPSHVCQFW